MNAGDIHTQDTVNIQNNDQGKTLPRQATNVGAVKNTTLSLAGYNLWTV